MQLIKQMCPSIILWFDVLDVGLNKVIDSSKTSKSIHKVSFYFPKNTVEVY